MIFSVFLNFISYYKYDRYKYIYIGLLLVSYRPLAHAILRSHLGGATAGSRLHKSTSLGRR